MRVSLTFRERSFEGVVHLSCKSDGTLVLRFSGHKSYIQPDEYSSFNVVPE